MKTKKYTKEALSMYKGSDNEWKLIMIPYNPDTEEVGSIQVLKSDKEWSEIVAEFENLTDEKLFNDSN